MQRHRAYSGQGLRSNVWGSKVKAGREEGRKQQKVCDDQVPVLYVSTSTTMNGGGAIRNSSPDHPRLTTNCSLEVRRGTREAGSWMGHDSACTGLLRAFRNRPPHCRWRARFVYTMMGPRVLSIKLASPEGPSSGLDARRRWAAAGSAGGATGHVKALGPLSSQGKGAAPQRNERPAHSALGGHTRGSVWGGRGGT